MLALKLTTFSLLWIVIIYIVNCLFARKVVKIQLSRLAIYIFTMTALGLFGEIMFDTFYKLALGRPLWEYHLLPIHHGFTSFYSLVLWGAVGVHLYLLHNTLKARGIVSTHVLALIFCLEAILLEALVNLSYLPVFHDYVYYYLPSDLFHITSVQALPLYLLAGYITVMAMRYASQLPKTATIGNSLVLVAILALK
jgi:hypothetical protein